MKKSHIFAIVVIAAAIGIILSTAGDASTYVNFGQAYALAKEGSNAQIHVVGKLKKDPTGQIVGMRYNPQQDANRFTFVMVDNNSQEQEVVYPAPKPADFDRSEQIVVVGSVQNGTFRADKILMKCPSKYQEGKLETTEATAKKS